VVIANPLIKAPPDLAPLNRLERTVLTVKVIKPFDRFPPVECPNCKVAMVLKDMWPVLVSDDLYHARFRCGVCAAEVAREFKREQEPVSNGILAA
jgi:hypothetical protein